MSLDGYLVSNPHFPEDDDFLYHFGLSSKANNFSELFSDVKFVCCGGSAARMLHLAEMLAQELNIEQPSLKNLSRSERFCIYKAGPVLCINHGMGTGSISVMLVETLKLLYHAGCQDVRIIRVGTSGGIGLEPGTVVVSTGAVNGLLEPFHRQFMLGKEVKREAILDSELSDELLALKPSCPFPVSSGSTMCTDDFYEGQGRLDGALCDYSMEDKFRFLQKAYDAGVRNIEMESTCFASFCHRAKVKGAIVCATLLDRLKGDQVTTPKETMSQWETRPGQLVILYIRKRTAQQ